ncbi:DUF6232 family protein [Streptomyces sp. NPDC093510]|uniref:DUF6232 family protein n=1 Tax=Streptomyces sp. NPDC093510 TaxID=3155199 RepID=UPI00343630FA
MISISVSRRVLWVDTAAYPLHNIARVTTRTVRPSFAKILKHVVRWLLVVYVVFMGVALYSTQGRTTLAGIIMPVVLLFLSALLISGLVRLFAAVARKALHQLNIETAGAPYAVLASPDRELVTQISQSIMEAIDNPQAEFQFQVENFHIGDSIKQFGNANTGKVAK